MIPVSIWSWFAQYPCIHLITSTTEFCYLKICTNLWQFPGFNVFIWLGSWSTKCFFMLCSPLVMYVITAALSAPPRHNFSSPPTEIVTHLWGLTRVLFIAGICWWIIYHGGGHVGNLCFLKVCWNFFGMDVVVIIQKGYHEAVRLKKYNAFNNSN